MKTKVSNELRKLNITSEDIILVAVSGGADSVALLRVLLELQMNVVCVHVEHGIRGEESLRDAKFVEKLCETLGAPFVMKRVNAPELAEKEHLSLEDAARKLRYEALQRVAAEEALTSDSKVYIATAHHLEDQVETMLLHAIRGAGPNGLVGMNTGAIIRPLLTTSREEIEEYLDQLNQDYCTDSTNADLENPRNLIRQEILPLLRKINPKAEEHFYALSQDIAEERNYIEAQAREVLEKCLVNSSTGKFPMLNRKILSQQTSQNSFLMQEVLRLFLTTKLPTGGVNLNRIQLNAAVEAVSAPSGFEVSLPGDYLLIATGDELVLTEKEQKEEALQNVKALQPEGIRPFLTESISLPVDLSSGEAVINLPTTPPGSLTFSREQWEKSKEIPRSMYTKVLDYAKISDTLVLRTRRTGDTISITKDGKKRFKDYLIDQKVPKELRDQIPLLACGNDIIWEIGGRFSEAWKVTEDTATVLRITWRTENE